MKSRREGVQQKKFLLDQLLKGEEHEGLTADHPSYLIRERVKPTQKKSELSRQKREKSIETFNVGESFRWERVEERMALKKGGGMGSTMNKALLG